MSELCTSKLEPLVEYLDSLSGRADLDTLQGLLERMDVTREDLRPVCKFKSTCYQRNRIRKTDWYELVALCWRAGQKSQIHDHASSSCAFRVIQGTVTERRFEKNADGTVHEVQVTTLAPGSICAAEDDAIHEVCNMAESDDLVTLHIYSPPLNMKVYDEGADSSGDCVGVYEEG